jgi:hypothetical protein
MGTETGMNHLSTWIGSISIMTLTWVGACGVDEMQETEALAFREDSVVVAERRPADGGGFINNGLHDPQVGGLDPAYALTTSQGLDGTKLDDPDRLATARYVVECALAPDQSVTKVVDGVTVEFEGALGLAPEWQDEPCDEECQEWVSACVLARTNVSEREVTLWLEGDHPALSTATHPSHPHYEASFFGNLFAGPDQEYMCPAPLVGPLLAQLDGRTCSSLLLGGCEFESYQACELTERCEFEGGLAPTVSDCKAGPLPGGTPLRTISTYVATPLPL